MARERLESATEEGGWGAGVAGVTGADSESVIVVLAVAGALALSLGGTEDARTDTKSEQQVRRVTFRLCTCCRPGPCACCRARDCFPGC